MRMIPVQPGTRQLIIIMLFMVVALVVNAAYTQYSIDSYSRKACGALYGIASAKGARTPFEHSIRDNYVQLYNVRCR